MHTFRVVLPHRYAERRRYDDMDGYMDGLSAAEKQGGYRRAAEARARPGLGTLSDRRGTHITV